MVGATYKGLGRNAWRRMPVGILHHSHNASFPDTHHSPWHFTKFVPDMGKNNMRAIVPDNRNMCLGRNTIRVLSSLSQCRSRQVLSRNICKVFPRSVCRILPRTRRVRLCHWARRHSREVCIGASLHSSARRIRAGKERLAALYWIHAIPWNRLVFRFCPPVLLRDAAPYPMSRMECGVL